ncbi:MAG: hypothetical protein H0U78_01965 [Rickettsiaceae bacterium]|jgi:hypothetical protein|nr:hypothetical protein [Rickettsiaceae bacterium]
MFAQIKNNFAIAYDQPLAFFKGSAYQAMYNCVKSVTTFVVKGVVHLARGAYDISCDVANVVINLVRSTEDQDIAFKHADVPAKTAAQSDTQEVVEKSSLAKLADFVSEISSEKDSTYLGSLSNNSKDYPAAKIVMDAIATVQCVGQDFVTEVLKMPTGVINSGLKSAYLSGIPASMKYETTNVENDFSNEDSFAPIDLDGYNEIEMVVLGDAAAVAA